jgi:hypothetical protein
MCVIGKEEFIKYLTKLRRKVFELRAEDIMGKPKSAVHLDAHLLTNRWLILTRAVPYENGSG